MAAAKEEIPTTSATQLTALDPEPGIVLINSDLLSSLLECPVCLDQCVPPIYTCRIGHAICKECAPSLYRCPICRSGYMGTRDFIAEALYTKLDQLGGIKKQEEIDLDSRGFLIQCHLGTLSEALKTECDLGSENAISDFVSYMEHLTGRHKVSNETVELDSTFTKRFYYRNNTNTFVRNGKSKLIILNCASNHFLVSLYQEADHVYAFVATDKKVAKEFQVEIKVPHGTMENENVATFKGQVVELKKCPTQIFQTKACLIVNVNDLLRGVRRTRRVAVWVLNVTITRKELLGAENPNPIVLDDDVGQVRRQFQSMSLEDPDYSTRFMQFLNSPERDLDGLLPRTDNQNAGSDFGSDGSIRTRIPCRARRPMRGPRQMHEFDLPLWNELPVRDRFSLASSRGRPTSAQEGDRNRTGLPERPTEDRSGRPISPSPRREDSLRTRRSPFANVIDEARRRRMLRRTPGNSVITARDFCADSDEERAVMERLERETDSNTTTTSPNRPDQTQQNRASSEDEDSDFFEHIQRMRQARFRHGFNLQRNQTPNTSVDSHPSPIRSNADSATTTASEGNPRVVDQTRTRTPLFRARETRDREYADALPEVEPGCIIS